MKHLLTYFKNMDPTSSENVGSNYSLGQEWYNTITGDKFYHKSDGVWVKSTTDVSSPIVEVTYSELNTLKTDSLLIPGKVYLLTDYMTRYEQPVSGDIISSGVVEPLYITATGVNTLSNICMSKLYPQDIVYYEITGIIDENYGTEGFNKGKIYRRIDTIRNNDIGTDWRHVKYRRYALNVTNSYLAGTSYVREDVVNDELFIYICVEDDPNSATLDSKKWFRYIYNNGQYRSLSQTEVLVTLYSSYSPDAASIPVDSADYEDYLLFPVIDGSDYYENGDIYNNIINTYNLSNNVIYNRFNNNTINTNRFLNNNIGIAERNHVNFTFGDNNLGTFIGNTVIGSTENNIAFGQNHIANFEQNQVSSAFNRNFIIDGNFRWNTISRDFIANTILYGWQNCNIGEYTLSNLTTSDTFDNINISHDFFENKIRRSFLSCNFGRFRYFDIPDTTSVGFKFWTFSGYLAGYGISLPEISDTYVPTMYAAGNTVFVKYDDEHGDTIILGQPETFSFRSNQENLAISASTATSSIIRVDWGDTTVWTSIEDTSFSTSNTYTGKANTDEYSISIGGNYIYSINISSNGITYFNPIDLPSSLTSINLGGNQLTNFDPSIALPSLLTNLDLNSNQLTSFDPSIALPGALTTLDLQSNQLSSFDPSIALPSSLEYLYLQNNQLTSFDPSIALPISLTNLSLSNNQLSSFDPSIALPNSLVTLSLNTNPLINFNPSVALPSSLTGINLENTQLTSFDPSVALPNSLIQLLLSSNALTSFDPTIALPSTFENLYLSYNQLTSFDPSIALPSTLRELNLNNNDLTDFDPTIALPDGLDFIRLDNNLLTAFDTTLALPTYLEGLYIRNNNLTSFNPTLALPFQMTYLLLDDNQLNTTEVNNTLIMLNTTYTNPGYKVIGLRMNPPAPPSGAGLTAKAALQAKGYNVATN